MKKMNKEIINEFGKTYKVALVSTIDNINEPHLSFITTLQAKNENTLTIGEFITGLSKSYMQIRNKVGFLVMSLDKNWWNGSCQWNKKETSGEDYEKYNQIPMFRYNTYFGIHTAHYFSLNNISKKYKLDMKGIIFNAIVNVLIKPSFKRKSNPTALTTWAHSLLKGIATLKFISFIGDDGFPKVYPIVQAQACDKSRIVIPMHPYSKELSTLKEGTKIAIMGMNLDMENVHLNGTFSGFKSTILGKMGYMDIERVYNSMPPTHGYIYPAQCKKTC